MLQSYFPQIIFRKIMNYCYVLPYIYQIIKTIFKENEICKINHSGLEKARIQITIAALILQSSTVFLEPGT